MGVGGGGQKDSSHLAPEFVLQREVDKADTGVDQPIDEAHDVQPGLVLGGHHAHEDLTAQGLHAVFFLQHLPDPFFRQAQDTKASRHVQDNQDTAQSGHGQTGRVQEAAQGHTRGGRTQIKGPQGTTHTATQVHIEPRYIKSRRT